MKKKSKYAAGGPIGPEVMPTPLPRPSDFRVGQLQFGGVGDANMPGNMGNYSSPMNRPMLNDGRPMREQRGMENMRQVVKYRLKEMPEKFDGMNKRMRQNAPAPVGPGGGYKKGGKIDGCATRGMTKGLKK